MLSPSQLDLVQAQFEGVYQELETFILQDAARRIKKAASITSTAEWQIQQAKLYNIKNIEKKIAEVLKLSQDQVDELFPQIANISIEQENAIYKQAKLSTIALSESKALRDYLEAAIETTKGDLSNITQSLGFAEMQNGHIVYSDIGKFYQKELNVAHLKVMSGASDYNSAIRQAVRKMSDSGLRYVNYKSGYSNEAYVAVRRAVLTSTRTMSQQMSIHNMDMILGKDSQRFVEVSYHSGNRPSHWWGGMVFEWK